MKNIVDKYLKEVVTTAIDTSGDHPSEGFPEIPIPIKIHGPLSRAIGGKNIMKVFKSGKDMWCFQIKLGGFEIRSGDFTDLYKIGLCGIRAEMPKSILLYFKGNY